MGRFIPCLLISLLVVSVSLPQANAMVLEPMAPDSVGLTVKKSPVLFVFLSHATSFPIRFTLFESGKSSPAIEVPLRAPTRPGFWAIRLEDYHIVLEEDVQYRWFVTVLQDPDLPRRNIVAGGNIERVDPRLINFYGGPCDKDSVLLSQKAGVWYDTFACVMELIGANPQDPTLHELRDELMGWKPSLIYFP
jgi:uncharacterized protein DUF928